MSVGVKRKHIPESSTAALPPYLARQHAPAPPHVTSDGKKDNCACAQPGTLSPHTMAVCEARAARTESPVKWLMKVAIIYMRCLLARLSALWCSSVQRWQ